MDLFQTVIQASPPMKDFAETRRVILSKIKNWKRKPYVFFYKVENLEWRKKARNAEQGPENKLELESSLVSALDKMMVAWKYIL